MEQEKPNGEHLFNPKIAYNDLPLLPPNTDVETKQVLLSAISANRAVAELKGVGSTIPDQRMLINSLVLQEAKASSEIENIVTTNDRLFRAFSATSQQFDPATKEVLHYREAVWEGFNALQNGGKLETELFIRLQQTITDSGSSIRTGAGTVISNLTTKEVIYTPPVGERVIREKLLNLERFIQNGDKMDPLVKMALLHYQFEAIHPFLDGNGRTGRIINILYLIQQGLLDLPVLYLSKAIIERKREYYQCLQLVTERGLWETWLLFMLSAIETTANQTREKIIAIRTLLAETLEIAKRDLPNRVYSKELVELLFMQPYTKVQFLVSAGIAERKTAAEYLKELEKIGILTAHPVGRELLYLNVRLYELLAQG